MLVHLDLICPYLAPLKSNEQAVNQLYIVDSDPDDVLFLSTVDLFLPKFSINADASLESTLKEMGIIAAFSDKADFSEISDEIKLKVSKVGEASHCVM